MVVDIQPCYVSYMGNNILSATLEEILERLARYETVWMLYNNEDLSGDLLCDIHDLWRDAGMSEEAIGQCHWVEKQYAFLRGWMDIGIDHDEIVVALKLLQRLKQMDSRDVPEDELARVSSAGSESCNPLFDSYELQQSGIGRLSAVDICGGGRDECLLETEIWLTSRGVQFNRLDHLTY